MKKYIFLAFISTLLFACSPSKNKERNASDSTFSTLLENEKTTSVSKTNEKQLNIEEYFKIIPEKYLPIPLNRRNAVLNAKNPEFCVTLKHEDEENACWHCNISDKENGFISVTENGADWGSVYDIAYWTLSDGRRWLAVSNELYNFEIDKDEYFVHFLQYHSTEDKWEELPNPIPKLTLKEIVPQNLIKKWDLSPEYAPNFSYELPQKGKNILLHWYVATEFPKKDILFEEQKQIPNTIELVWEDGKFRVGSKYYR